MFFKDVIGQSVVKEKLILSVQNNSVSHAQLYLGGQGCGSLALALAFIQYLNCENRQADDSCGKCASCIKSHKMIHPDIHFSFPVFKLKPGSENPALSDDFVKKFREAVLDNPYMNINDWLDFIGSENKQGNISAEECRNIIQKLTLKTFESKFKVMVIWLAEYLGKEGNLLLKILEEPTPNTLIILLAENRDAVIKTILSRCQIVPIPRIDDNDLLEVLLNKHQQPRDSAAKILRQSQGNYREAIRIINQAEEDEPEMLKQWMRLLVDMRYTAELVKWVEEISRTGREKQKQFLRYTLEFIRECIVLQNAGAVNSRLYDEEMKVATFLINRLNMDDWQRMDAMIEKSHYHIERNASPKILFMNLSISFRKLFTSNKLTLAG